MTVSIRALLAAVMFGTLACNTAPPSMPPPPIAGVQGNMPMQDPPYANAAGRAGVDTRPQTSPPAK